MSKVEAFIEELKTNKFLRKVLGTVKHGDWDEIVRIAAYAGFRFSKDELHDAVPIEFFQGYGQNQDAGWHPSTLPVEHLIHKLA